MTTAEERRQMDRDAVRADDAATAPEPASIETKETVGGLGRTPVDRRALLRFGLAGAGAATLGRVGLGSAGARGAPAAQGTPAAADACRITSSVPGAFDAYTCLPEPFESVAAPPGRGGTVRVLTLSYQPPPAPKGENRFWQELEQRLGVTWDAIIAPHSTYGEQTAALIAGGELPDLFYLNPGQDAAHLNLAIQQGAFADLTPYLSGDGLQQFPNLALFPDYIWKNVAIGGKIYGVPRPNFRHGNVPFYRADWVEQLGLALPENAEGLNALMVGLSTRDPDGNGQDDTFGMGAWQGFFSNDIVEETFRSPNEWRLNPDGTLTYYLETPEYRQALEFMRQLWADGAYHPDAAGLEFIQAQDLFLGGTTASHAEGFGAYFGTLGLRNLIRDLGSPDAELLGLLPVGFDGGPAVTFNQPGFFGFTAIPASVAQDEARVVELLGILNYLAAPLGSVEYQFSHFGIEGVHHTLDESGAPVRTAQGETDIANLLYFIEMRESVHFYPGRPGDAEYAQELGEQIAAIGIDNPTVGLFSPTQSSAGVTLNQLRNDRLTAIVTGREPLETLDTWISDWRSRGGDQIRQEFETALQGS